MLVSIHAAVAENGVIGRAGGLPWRLSTDLARFKANTLGKPVIFGRKTWETFPRRPLPDRPNLLLTRDTGFVAQGAELFSTLKEALTRAKELAVKRDEIETAEACVIGGGEIYRLAVPLADRLHITHVLAAIDGDTKFPEIDPLAWAAVSSEDVAEGPKDSHPTRYVVYERSVKASAPSG